MMELVVIRHAQSTNNALTDGQDRVSDPPLTSLGRRQAQIVAHHLANGADRAPLAGENDSRRGHGITRLYCSPMWRALQTAQPIGQALGLAPEVWIDIHEWGGIYLDHGEASGIIGYPGKTRSEILAEFMNYILPEGITERGWWRQGHEELPACYRRAIKVVEELYKRAANAADDERIAIVSHGGFISVLLNVLFGQLSGRHVYYHQHNTAISRIDFRSGGHLDVQYLNRMDHLPPELVS